MQVQATSVSSSITVWVERADGTILRGRAETVSARGARVLLPGRCAFLPEEPVVLRVCFSPERPTVAASAQVRWSRQLGETVDCGLDWDLATVELQ
jgi:PilZ domain